MFRVVWHVWLWVGGIATFTFVVMLTVATALKLHENIRARRQEGIERRKRIRDCIEGALTRWRGPKMTGRELRDFLDEMGFRLSLPAFYSLMAEFEDEGWLQHEELWSRRGSGRERWFSLRKA